MKKVFILFFSLMYLASCTSDISDVANVAENGGDGNKVKIIVHPIEFEDGTRTCLTDNVGSITFGWDFGNDEIGVFPINPVNNQAFQTIVGAACEPFDDHYSEGVGNPPKFQAVFVGNGWALDPGNTYAAYFPYNADLNPATAFDKVPYSMDGQDGTLATIGKKYDFMWAKSDFVADKDHYVVFDFAHSISILKLNLTLPMRTTWRKIEIGTPTCNSVWIDKATIDVSNGTVTRVKRDDRITIWFDKNNRGIINNLLTANIYLAVLPTTPGEIYVSLFDTYGYEYTARAERNTPLDAGKAYNINLAFALSRGNYIEDGDSLLVWAPTNVGAEGETDNGNYYAFFESRTKDLYTLENYVKESADPVTALLGKPWRLPTAKEVNQLYSSYNWEYKASYKDSGTSGYLGISASKDSIFFPFAGYKDGSVTNDLKTKGYYWISNGSVMNFTNESKSIMPFTDYMGASMRPVAKIAKP